MENLFLPNLLRYTFSYTIQCAHDSLSFLQHFYRLACAIFHISTGRNSIAEFEQTSPFLTDFQAHF